MCSEEAGDGYVLVRVPADQVRKAEPGKLGTPERGEWVWLASREDWDIGPFEVPAETSRADLREHYRRVFALQGQASDLGGRHIITCGSGWRKEGLYGAVTATYPEGSRVARRDSWRCHHGHPDDLAALECALGEVRRLASGGRYEPCSAGPDCQDEFCRKDWAGIAERQPGSSPTGAA